MSDVRGRPSIQLGLKVGDLVRVREPYIPTEVGWISWVAGHNITVDLVSGGGVYVQEWGADKLGVHQLTDDECAALMKWSLTHAK